jgi:hypothetical protein
MKSLIEEVLDAMSNVVVEEVLVPEQCATIIVNGQRCHITVEPLP